MRLQPRRLLPVTLVGEQDCAIKFLRDGAQCSGRCVPCVDDINKYGVNIDGCFSGGGGYGCIPLEIEDTIGENHDRSLAPPDFVKACDDITSTYTDSECRCYVGELTMECRQDNTTEFDLVYLSFSYDSNLSKVSDGSLCFCASMDCGGSPSDYCIRTTLIGEPVCNMTYLQTNEVFTDCCVVCNSNDYYGVNTNECYTETTEPPGCFSIGINKQSGENHALGTSDSSSSASPTGPQVYEPTNSPTGPQVYEQTNIPSEETTSPTSIHPTNSTTFSPTSSPTSQPTFESAEAPSDASVIQPPRTTMPTNISSSTPTSIPSIMSTDTPSSTPSSLPPTMSTNKTPSSTKTSLPPTTPPTTFTTVEATGATFLTTIFADGDTYIYKNGFVPPESSGEEETMLVQNGPEENPTVPDTYALISFPVGQEISMLSTSGSTSRSSFQPVKANLCLQHVRNDSPNAAYTTYSLCRIDTSASKGANFLDVDNMTGSNVSFSIPGDCVGGETSVIDFEVARDDTEICVDIVEALRAPTESPILTRRLEPEELLDDTLLFMIDNLYTEQLRGDLFYTSNAGVSRSPKIVINTQSIGPAPSPQPSHQTYQPGPGLIILTGDSVTSDDKNRNVLYSLFLLLLLVPLAFILMKRRKRRENEIDCKTMPSPLEIYLNNPEMEESFFFDEEEDPDNDETFKEQEGFHYGNETGNIESGSILEETYALSENNASSNENSESDDSDENSEERSTVNWEDDSNKLVTWRVH
ncbi:hypothetical protein IV203_007124 [Nitzschia inconspicua]|uniref:Uncharacterized protein n=1 Tax=Nitzschia inconspicua TaxID=303405 RepID=A0A9K3KE21_9STRA|nr:hypothetical protein IV203_007124 [Nitzschia inconspicua]